MRRFVLPILCVVGILSIGAFVTHRKVRDDELEALYRVWKSHGEAGRGNSLDDLIAELPPLNLDRQRRIRELLESYQQLEDDAYWHVDAARYVDRDTARSNESAAWHERLRPFMERFFEILEEDTSCLSSVAWINERRDELEQAPIDEPCKGRPKLGNGIHRAVGWLEAEVLTQENPTSSLRRMDLLWNSLNYLGDGSDWHSWLIASYARDSLYCVLALRGDLPESTLWQWIAEPSQSARNYAGWLRYERIAHVGRLSRRVLKGEDVSDCCGRHLGFFARLRMSSPLEVAQALEFGLAAEDYLLGSATAARVRVLGQRLTHARYPISMMTNLESMSHLVSASRQIDAAHRSIRIGTLLAVAAQRRRELPNSHDDALTWLPEAFRDRARATPTRQGLLIERLDEQTLRVRPDPWSEVPGFHPSARPPSDPLANENRRRRPRPTLSLNPFTFVCETCTTSAR